MNRRLESVGIHLPKLSRVYKAMNCAPKSKTIDTGEREDATVDAVLLLRAWLYARSGEGAHEESANTNLGDELETRRRRRVAGDERFQQLLDHPVASIISH